MKYMYQLFYQYDHSVFMKKFTERTSFDSVVWLDLSIRPIDQPETYKLYYIPTNKIIHLVTEIYKVTEALNASYHQLPQVAQEQFISENIIDELYHTNDLEGVHSSKAEIAKALHLSDTTVRNIAKQLLAKSYIKQKGIRPAYYSLHEAYLEMS